jgi:hypothetical protein
MIIEITHKILQEKDPNIKKMNKKLNLDIQFRKDKATTKFREFPPVRITKKLM